MVIKCVLAKRCTKNNMGGCTCSVRLNDHCITLLSRNSTHDLLDTRTIAVPLRWVNGRSKHKISKSHSAKEVLPSMGGFKMPIGKR